MPSSPVNRRPLPRTPKKLDPIPGREARDEQTLGMILALTSEITILRARLDACERLLVDAKVLPTGAIDSFAPDAAAQAEREALRTRSIAKILRPMHELAEHELAVLTAESDL
jgi:hypothetical protein